MGEAGKAVASALAEMVIRQLETESDSRFLGFVALTLGSNDDGLARYVAGRIDRIAAVMQAGEEMGS